MVDLSSDDDDSHPAPFVAPLDSSSALKAPAFACIIEAATVSRCLSYFEYLSCGFFMVGCRHNEEIAIKLVVAISWFGNENKIYSFGFPIAFLSTIGNSFFIQDSLWD
jgi:hypothetical protein